VAGLWFLLHLREGHRRQLVFSGLALGLAVATKLPAVLLAAPLLISVVVVESGRWPGFPSRGFQRRACELTVWAVVGAAIVVAIWPVLWVWPLGLLRQLLADLVGRPARTLSARTTRGRPSMSASWPGVSRR